MGDLVFIIQRDVVHRLFMDNHITGGSLYIIGYLTKQKMRKNEKLFFVQVHTYVQIRARLLAAILRYNVCMSTCRT